MRIFVLVLLVLLLPLRSGLGDAMAATGPHHGTTHQQEHQQEHQQHEVSTSAAVAYGLLQDCAGYQAGHGPSMELVSQPADTGMQTNAACDACSACQSCHAVGLAFSSADVQPLPAPNAQPAALSPRFASAPAARDQKPPIS